MKTSDWQAVFRIAKTYGINHYRFHSWTPPRAAFEAADIEGIYMQPELPYWGRLRTDDPSGLNEFLVSEGENILEKYSNHASFVMFALGNELSGSQEQMQKMVSHFRELNPEKLYAFGSNNYLGFRGQPKERIFTSPAGLAPIPIPLSAPTPGLRFRLPTLTTAGLSTAAILQPT
jgi:beta-galactosidase/beta-glucuronidase